MKISPNGRASFPVNFISVDIPAFIPIVQRIPWARLFVSHNPPNGRWFLSKKRQLAILRNRKLVRLYWLFLKVPFSSLTFRTFFYFRLAMKEVKEEWKKGQRRRRRELKKMLRKSFKSSKYLSGFISKFLKVSEIAWVIGSLEAEGKFSLVQLIFNIKRHFRHIFSIIFLLILFSFS